MRFDLVCQTQAGLHAVYDPAAVPPLDRPARGEDPVEAEATKGNLIAYSSGSNGPAHFRVFVDEPVDPGLEKRADGTTRGVLRVPTGHLVASGAEAHDIPAGTYEVTAFDVEWRGEDLAASSAAAMQASRTGFSIDRILGPFSGALVVLTVVGALLLVGDWVIGDATLRTTWTRLATYGSWLGIVWLVVIALWFVPAVRRADEARTRAQADYPDAVIHLRRLPDGEDVSARTGVTFGVGFTEG